MPNDFQLCPDSVSLRQLNAHKHSEVQSLQRANSAQGHGAAERSGKLCAAIVKNDLHKCRSSLNGFGRAVPQAASALFVFGEVKISACPLIAVLTA